MILVVADTTPLNYLILIECEEVLAKLFTRVLIPPAVLRELQDSGTPEVVRQWTEKLPAWLEVRPAQERSAGALPVSLGAGEREAIALGAELHADLLLVDDREAREEASKHGLRILGTLGLLERAAELGLVSLPETIERLGGTTFRIARALVEDALRRDVERRQRQ